MYAVCRHVTLTKLIAALIATSESMLGISLSWTIWKSRRSTVAIRKPAFAEQDGSVSEVGNVYIIRHVKAIHVQRANGEAEEVRQGVNYALHMRPSAVGN